jgi:predicted amidohydrolase
MQKECITIYQRPAQALPDRGSPEYNFLLKIGAFSNTLIFPEYFSFHNGVKSFDDMMLVSADSLKKLFRLSLEEAMENTMIVGGTVIFSKDDKLYNTAPIIYNGALLGNYFKRNLFLNESHYLSSGDRELVIEHPETRDNWGFLICADVKSPEFFTAYRDKVRYIAIPVASPFLPDDTDEARLHRDWQIFQVGAQKSAAILFKCCLTGQPGTIDDKLSPMDSPKVQGRSLIATPDKILVRAPHIDWRGALIYSRRDGGVKMMEY